MNGRSTADREVPPSSEREWPRARTNRRRQVGPTGQRARERQRRKRARAGAQGRRSCERASAGLGQIGWLGRIGFLFFSRISNGFSILFSLGFSIQIQSKFQIQTNSNMGNNSKNILSSA
jgi:hypothetical protein